MQNLNLTRKEGNVSVLWGIQKTAGSKIDKLPRGNEVPVPKMFHYDKEKAIHRATSYRYV